MFKIELLGDYYLNLEFRWLIDKEGLNKFVEQKMGEFNFVELY